MVELLILLTSSLTEMPFKTKYSSTKQVTLLTLELLKPLVFKELLEALLSLNYLTTTTCRD